MNNLYPINIEGTHLLDPTSNVNKLVVHYVYKWLTEEGKYEIRKQDISIISRVKGDAVEYAVMLYFKKIGTWSQWQTLSLKEYHKQGVLDDEGLKEAMRIRFKLRRVPNKTITPRVKKEIANVLKQDDLIFIKYTDGSEELTTSIAELNLSELIIDEDTFEPGDLI